MTLLIILLELKSKILKGEKKWIKLIWKIVKYYIHVV